MQSLELWTLFNEGGIPGPKAPEYKFNSKDQLTFESLPMRDLSDQGMANLCRYLEEAGNEVLHDEDRNCTLVRIDVKSEGVSYLCLNFDGTWHFERQIDR
jgi:hypothetical protein